MIRSSHFAAAASLLLLAISTHCNRNQTSAVRIGLYCDVSVGGGIGLENVEVADLAGIKQRSTVTLDRRISTDQMTASFVDGSSEAQIKMAVPLDEARIEGSWAFLVSHNLNQKVQIRFEGAQHIRINGRDIEETHPVILDPGSHGFEVRIEGVGANIAHVFMPLRE